jgi:hypothetical protein
MADFKKFEQVFWLYDVCICIFFRLSCETVEELKAIVVLIVICMSFYWIHIPNIDIRLWWWRFFMCKWVEAKIIKGIWHIIIIIRRCRIMRGFVAGNYFIGSSLFLFVLNKTCYRFLSFSFQFLLKFHQLLHRNISIKLNSFLIIFFKLLFLLDLSYFNWMSLFLNQIK